jgi:two-component system phosphate regulon response regulator PhoB
VCRELKSDRATQDVPVVIVSASGAEIDRVVSLELGAEDFVVRPYSPRELVLRVRAILRRRKPVAQHVVEEWGGMRVDRAAYRLWVEHREIVLTPTEWKLFVYLFDARERVRTRAELLRDIWSLGEPSETRSVDAMVARLREKLGTAGAHLVTVRGVGYRLSLQEESESVARTR